MVICPQRPWTPPAQSALRVLVAVALYLALPLAGSASATTTIYTSEATFQTAAGALSLANFDTDALGATIAAGTVINAQYLSLGADFNPFNGGSNLTAAWTPHSSPNVLLNGASIGSGGGGFEVVFSGTVQALGLWFGGLDAAPTYQTTLEIFGSGGASLQSFVVQDANGSNNGGHLFFGLTSTVGIGRFTVAVSGNDFAWFDDLSFGAVSGGSTVPEPGALLLAGAAVPLILRRLRRRPAA